MRFQLQKTITTIDYLTQVKNNTFSDGLMPSLLWNTDINQMMVITLLMIRVSKEMDKNTNWEDYWSRIGFIKD